MIFDRKEDRELSHTNFYDANNRVSLFCVTALPRDRNYHLCVLICRNIDQARTNKFPEVSRTDLFHHSRSSEKYEIVA